jgi:DNA/RNA-binding domain of Phe-tRNA-synthetase-like protein
MIPIEIERSLLGTLKIGVLFFQGLTCQRKNVQLWEEIQKLAEDYHKKFSEPSQAVNLLKPARDLYRKIGIEPTKVRPSSEALLRRAINAKELYQINSIVDSGNLCSLRFLLPIGLYDLSKIEGHILLRKGMTGEEFQGIRKDIVHVEGRYILADQIGPFGNPSSDSMRTSIELSTKDLLFVIYAPFYYSDEELLTHINLAEQKILEYNQGSLIDRSITKD